MKKVVSDFLWHNSSTGETQIWYMHGHRIASRATVVGQDGSPALVGKLWSIVATSDTNGDGKSDIILYNGSTSHTQIWYMDGHKVTGQPTVVGENGRIVNMRPPWSIAGTGDTNGDGKADIIWHNSSTGRIQIWYMDGHRIVGRGTVVGQDGSPALVGMPWGIVATGDTNGDGKADIMWHDSSTGYNQIWYMDGHKVIGRAMVHGEDNTVILMGPPWSIAGNGDTNGDGKADIIWHNSSTGETQIWYMDGYRIASRAMVHGEDDTVILMGPPWNIVGNGIFNAYGNGKRYYRFGKQPFFIGGAIGEKYAELGGTDSWLGWPTSDEQPFVQNGRISTFDNGAIYWWKDTGAIELGNVSVRYKGLYCFGKTVDSSDKPYVIFGIVPVPPAPPAVGLTQIYSGVDGGTSRLDDLELYRGSPHGILLGITLCGHERGDPNKYLDQVKAGAAKTGQDTAIACGTTVFGPEAALICEGMWKEVASQIVSRVNGIPGTDDDRLIEKWVWKVTAKEMVMMSRHDLHDFWGIVYHLESEFLRDDKASYKLFLAIDAV